MTKPELGIKRECPECAVKYYDLGRIPCLCPKCSASFEPNATTPSRPVKTEISQAKEKTEAAKTGEKIETVSHGELADEEQDDEDNMDDSDEAALTDIDIPDEDDDSDDDSESNDVFLDTEDDDTDVSGLLGTGVGKGEDEG